jgi:thioredoxin reductase
MTTTDYKLDLTPTDGSAIQILENDVVEVRALDDDDYMEAEVFEVTTASGETYEVDYVESP